MASQIIGVSPFVVTTHLENEPVLLTGEARQRQTGISSCFDGAEYVPLGDKQ